MKTNIILIRHGETEWNKDFRFQGSTDIPLCEEGISQANLLSKRLNGAFDVVYTSPLVRALHTAQVVAGEVCEPIVLPELREINFGSWEGYTLEKIKAEFPTEYHRWRNDKETGQLMGGDASIKNAAIRGHDAILSIVDNHPGKTIAVVAHGGILKAALIGLFNWDMTMYHSFFLGNTSITRLRFNGQKKPILMGLNDTCHLDAI